MRNKKAFTLIELIVVITILAILWTISFISFQWFTRDARNSKRIADINNINKALTFYVSERGTYPVPSNAQNISYSWATLWKQGTIGDSVIANLGTLNKKPVDPLYDTEYTYSLTAYGNEFEIWGISENKEVAFSSPLINQTYAASANAVALIKGNYNGKFVISERNPVEYIVAVPSIISSNISDADIETIVANNSLNYHGYFWAPHSYSWAIDIENNFDYLNGELEVFSWSVYNDLKNGDNLYRLVDNLQKAYSGSIINPYSWDLWSEKAEILRYTWNVIWEIMGIPEIEFTKSCEEILNKWKSEGNGFYTLFSDDEDTIYQAYCDMVGWGWTFLFSVNPSGQTWRFDSQQWTKPSYNQNFWEGTTILWNELTSYAYGEFANNTIKICRGSFSSCYEISHNQERTLKSFYNEGDSFVQFSRCSPSSNSRCNSWQDPDDIGIDSSNTFFSSLSYSYTRPSSLPRFWLGININYKNRIWYQADHNNTWPDFDNIWMGIGVFQSYNCWLHDGFVDITRARSVTLANRCAYNNPDTQYWYVFAK